MRQQATLLLEDGTQIKSKSFGALGTVVGELIFNTSMSGYQEIVSNPANANKIIIMTYPEIGNYGVNEEDFEAIKPFAKGMIVKNHNPIYSHYKANKSLGDYFKEFGLIGIENVDTRSLVKKIREAGSMKCLLTTDEIDEGKIEWLRNYTEPQNLVDEVTIKEAYDFSVEGEIKLGVIDYGVSKSTLKSLADRGCKIKVFPAKTQAETILNESFDAILLSDGPSNPEYCIDEVQIIKELQGKVPLYGVGLGCQLLAISLGAKTYKLKYGHYGSSYPVISLKNNEVLITGQNHSYAVSEGTLPDEATVTHTNLNDKTLEGFEMEKYQIKAIQFCPEHAPTPFDAQSVFNEWINSMKEGKNAKK